MKKIPTIMYTINLICSNLFVNNIIPPRGMALSIQLQCDNIADTMYLVYTKLYTIPWDRLQHDMHAI